MFPCIAVIHPYKCGYIPPTRVHITEHYPYDQLLLVFGVIALDGQDDKFPVGVVGHLPNDIFGKGEGIQAHVVFPDLVIEIIKVLRLPLVRFL